MLKYRHGPVAQRIEQDGSNVKVGGSIPFRVAQISLEVLQPQLIKKLYQHQEKKSEKTLPFFR